MIVECIYPDSISFVRKHPAKQFKVGDQMDVLDSFGEYLIKSGKWKRKGDLSITEQERNALNAHLKKDEEEVKEIKKRKKS